MTLGFIPKCSVGIVNFGDDAGVYLVREDLAIVNTVDFFTPVVDDPFTYGQIAAANALSDVYAMGGTPKTALNIVCWPQSGLPGEMLGEILRGGVEKASEAGVAIVGGHSVADEEVKYGMAVTGVIDPRRIVRNDRTQAGDALLLSKPIGTGVLMTALKRGKLPRISTQPRGAGVRTERCDRQRDAQVRGSRGDRHHGFRARRARLEMAEGSGVTLWIEESDLPLMAGALEWCRAMIGGSKAIANSMRREVRISDGEWPTRSASWYSTRRRRAGLFIALPEKDAIKLLADLQAAGNTDAAIVGRVVARGNFRLRWSEGYAVRRSLHSSISA